MKFNVQFLTVLTATATLAVPVNNNNLRKCNEIINIKYQDCGDFLLEEAYDENACVVIESEKCQKFYNTSIADLYAEFPECKDLLKDGSIEKEELEEAEEYQKLIKYFAKYDCARDEQGNLCPYTPSAIQKVYNDKSALDYDDEIFIKSVKESCKSKKCVDEFLTSYEQYYKTSIFYNELSSRETSTAEELVSYLKTETCTAQNVQTSGNTDGKTNNTNGNANGKTDASNGKTDGKTDGKTNGKTDDKTSGATQITYSSVLIISLTILLSALF